MRALIFGGRGQVGRELSRTGRDRGIEVTALSRDDVDLCMADAVSAAILNSDCDVVVNAAAYTAVDDAEDARDVAFAVNAAAPAAMAAACAQKGIPFLHVSTDYVFEGLAGPAKVEADATGPVSVYGESKLSGEEAVLASGADAVILRTAWVFSAHGGNFVKTMLRVGKGRDVLQVVGDQHGGPTAARDIANALWTIAEAWQRGEGKTGVYHFASLPSTTWADFAVDIFDKSGWDKVPEVRRITSDEWPTRARRPEHSILDCSAIHAAYGIEQPDWRPALQNVIDELKELVE